jgi:flagellar biogenesis protein FliO
MRVEMSEVKEMNAQTSNVLFMAGAGLFLLGLFLFLEWVKLKGRERADQAVRQWEE